MTSCLYECDVRHQRLRPAQKRFDYRVFMLSVDLDAPPRVPFLGLNRFNLFSLHDRDHVNLGKTGGIRRNLFAWMEKEKISVPEEARIQLLTLPRVLGYAFNPVSFYFISTKDDKPLFAIAEVGNTYREMKLFLVDGSVKNGWQRKVVKNFYVSPFSDVRDAFHFRLGLPGDSWTVHIDNLQDDSPSLVSSIRGISRPLTGTRLFWFGFKYPFLSLKVITMIHWQALKLWVRKVPHFPKSANRDSQQNILNPHSSLTSRDE